MPSSGAAAFERPQGHAVGRPNLVKRAKDIVRLYDESPHPGEPADIVVELAALAGPGKPVRAARLVMLSLPRTFPFEAYTLPKPPSEDNPEGWHVVRSTHGFTVLQLEARLKFVEDVLTEIVPGVTFAGYCLLLGADGFPPSLAGMLSELQRRGLVWVEMEMADPTVYLTKQGADFLARFPNVGW